MAITRRDFLKMSAATGAGLLLGVFDLKPIVAYAKANPPEWEYATASICCYCAVGCGIIVGSKSTEPYITYVQGDPDHPINRGALCSRGHAMAQLHTVDGAINPRRLLTPKVRRPGSFNWEDISWNDTLDEIAAHIKATRDGMNPGYSGNDPHGHPQNTILEEEIDGEMTPVNRCRGIACLGGAALTNEECYLLVKLARSLGIVYIGHQASI